MKQFFFLGLLGVLSACSFNKLFLQPTRMSPHTTKIKMVIEADTSFVYFDSTAAYQPVFLTSNNDTIQTNYRIQSFWITSENGNTLNAWLLQSKTVKPTASIIHFHGNAGFLLSQFQAMVPLLDKGFQAIVFDYSGFGFSSGKASRKNVLVDANSALSFVKSMKETQGLPLLIYGQSLGGHLSAVVAAQREKDIDALVIEGAFSSHKDIAARSAGFIGRMFVKEGYSAEKSLPNFHKPVLIIHSDEDEVIPFKQGVRLAECANEPKYFYPIKHGHIDGTSYYADSIAAKISVLLK
jgi:hypothetical protein